MYQGNSQNSMLPAKLVIVVLPPKFRVINLIVTSYDQGAFLWDQNQGTFSENKLLVQMDRFENYTKIRLYLDPKSDIDMI